jgi:uncharacterized protein (TIGR02284 family)
MVTVNRDVISTLVNLIEICKDGEVGYRNAAVAGRYPELMSLFDFNSKQRAEFGTELREEVRRLGGEPEDGDTAARALHRGQRLLQSGVALKPAQVISACEKGEDEALKAYREALDVSLPQEALQVVQRQFMKVQEAHERVRMYEVQNENDNVGSATDGAVD